MVTDIKDNTIFKETFWFPYWMIMEGFSVIEYLNFIQNIFPLSRHREKTINKAETILEKENLNSNHDNKDPEPADAGEASAPLPVPQVTIGPDGNIVINEKRYVYSLLPILSIFYIDFVIFFIRMLHQDWVL